MKIVNSEQMRNLEQAAVREGIRTETLMENAGLAVAEEAMAQLAKPRGSRVLVLIGPGNNGADGLIAAKQLHQLGVRVSIYVCVPRRSPDHRLTEVKERGVPVIEVSEDPELRLLLQYLKSASLVIDAILGCGNLRPITGPLEGILGQVTAVCDVLATPVIAVDVPTGLNADTGELDKNFMAATSTVALSNPKLGHVSFPGARAVGKLKVVDIGIPYGLDDHLSVELISDDLVADLLPPRPIDSHKNTFGRLLVVAGSRRYVGAACLACNGAYRAGAGLVTLAAPQQVYEIVASEVIETTHVPLSSTASGGIDSFALQTIQEIIADYDAVLLGCGLGQDPETQQFINGLLLDNTLLDATPLIIDADALNALAAVPLWHQHLRALAVMTPHPGEMSNLTKLGTSQIQAQRLRWAETSAHDWKQIVVLKGAYTVIASPEGEIRVSPFATPGLASAGTGDVLAGIIGGLVAQGVDPFDAATCGVYLHGAAAQSLSQTIGDAGLMAGDLLSQIPKQIKQLKDSSGNRIGPRTSTLRDPIGPNIRGQRGG